MDPKRTREALAWYAESYEIVGAGARPGERLASIIDAARWAVDLFEECENCKGRGFYVERQHGMSGEFPCESCKGRGFSLNKERVERATWAADPFEVFFAEDGHNGIRPRLASEIAEAAILAFLLEGPNGD